MSQFFWSLWPALGSIYIPTIISLKSEGKCETNLINLKFRFSQVIQKTVDYILRCIYILYICIDIYCFIYIYTHTYIHTHAQIYIYIYIYVFYILVCGTLYMALETCFLRYFAEKVLAQLMNIVTSCRYNICKRLNIFCLNSKIYFLF